MARVPARWRVMPSSPGADPMSSRSSPEQKPRPAPVSTATQQSLSAPTSSIAPYRAPTSPNDMELSRSGLFRVMSRTWERGVETTTSASAIGRRPLCARHEDALGLGEELALAHRAGPRVDLAPFDTTDAGLVLDGAEQ